MSGYNDSRNGGCFCYIECYFIRIIKLLKQIRDCACNGGGNGGICKSNNTLINETDLTQVVVDISESAQLITAIIGSWQEQTGGSNLVTIEIGTGTTGMSASFSKVFEVDSFASVANEKEANFSFSLTHPLLVEPGTGESVKVRLTGPNIDTVKFNILSCDA
ncbi:hypothetical protein [Oceanirhabdus seepicola]|uniref:Uncharacterized protein n=1 Tax=Oceanirhabdus seepicola TaxID=2828781 RepID=A0A9J6P1J3_9CLOT|nr:hypothetical protein [Oceanirhabdus seepicola]MCM1989741.1 hypothetical protein [Oceanirhabdus seepicola]